MGYNQQQKQHTPHTNMAQKKCPPSNALPSRCRNRRKNENAGACDIGTA
jgi:hypothetical protein